MTTSLRPHESSHSLYEAAINWACGILLSRGFKIMAPYEVISDMPWSTVIRFLCQQGKMYLKLMGSPYSIEAVLLEFLSFRSSNNITKVLAYNQSLSCFLMIDAGSPLRDYLKKNYQFNLVSNVLQAYASIQLSSIADVEALLHIGIPDWRLKKLPSLYQKFIAHTDLLKSDGLSDSEIALLQKLHSYIALLCDQLYELGIPETLEHGDLNDNNILIRDDKHLTISDWGDANISHPFLSLASWLDSAMINHQFNESDELYFSTQDAYLEKWLDYGAKNKLLHAFNLAKQLRYFQFALSFSRIKHCSHIENYKQYNGYNQIPATVYREIIEKFKFLL